MFSCHIVDTLIITYDRLLSVAVICRDVTKFEFDNVRTSNVFNRFKIPRMFKRFVIEFEFVKCSCSTTDFIFTESERVQTNQFFS